MSPVTKPKSTKTAKGEQTKALILNSALGLLREHGYEETTMRAIARKAGVSLGNAYHYFGSKEHMIQAFYHRTHEEHLAAVLPVLQKETSLKARLLSVMRLKISTLEPYHELGFGCRHKGAHPRRPPCRIALPAVAVSHGDHSLLDSRFVAQAKAHVSADRSDSRSAGQVDFFG